MKERAGFKCEWCGSVKYLNSHHIIGKRFAPLRFDINNGMCLCARCHKWAIGLAAHENPLRVAAWLWENRPGSHDLLIDTCRKYFEENKEE